MNLEESAKLIEKYNKIIENANDTITAYMQAKCQKKPIVKLFWDDINPEYWNHAEEMEGGYYIELFVYAFSSFEEYLKDHGCPQEEIDALLTYIVSCAYFHEYFHILFGHCSIPIPQRPGIKTDIRRQMEYACDMKAIDIMLQDIDFIYAVTLKDIRLLKKEYSTFLAALVSYYKFHEEKRLGEIERKLKKSEDREGYQDSITDPNLIHPFITFRFDYLAGLIENHVADICQRVNVDPVLFNDHIFNLCDHLLERYGITEFFKVDPTCGRNREEIEKVRDINFDEINKLCREIFIDDLKK